jgi:methionyl-tRNA formyltransferase
LRVAFAGTPQFALPALEALRQRTQLVGVLTPPDRPSGRGRQLTASAVKRAAEEHQLPLAQPASLKDPAVRAQLAAWRPDALVVVAYGLLLPPEVLALPRLGCLNIHASLLPRWRGAAPIERALLAGDATTGITIMQMDEGLDTGPILLQRPIAIGPEATGGTLAASLAELGATALLESLEGLERGTLSAVPQPEGATYAAKIDKREARIDWRQPAAVIGRQVRAFNPRPMAETALRGEQLRVISAAIEADSDDKIADHVDKSADPGQICGISGDAMRVRCGSGMLAVLSVQRSGRRPVSGREYAQGRTGQQLG